jgi:plastocyanin
MSDEHRTPRPRESLLLPIVIPLGILAVIGLVLWSFSRVLLRVSPHVATATALVVAAAIVAIVAIAASRPRVGNGSLLSVGVGVAGAAMLASGAALLLSGSGEEGGAPAPVAITAPAGAAETGFAETSVSAPSDEPFTISFDNQDPQVQHDVVVASDDPAKDPSAQTFLDGAVIAGPAQASYSVPALPEGSYYFFCKIHPTTMHGTLTASPAPAAGGGALSTSITASGLLFDTNTLTFPADGSKLTFQNNDAGTPHNLAIFTDASATTALFTGDAVTGVASATYDIPPMKPGTYYFHCDYHPESMNGTVTVVPAAKPSPGGGRPPPSGSVSPTPSGSASPTPSGSP